MTGRVGRRVRRLLIPATAGVLAVLIPATAQAVALGEPPIKQPVTPGVVNVALDGQESQHNQVLL